MGYGYDVLNNWREGRDVDWWAYGPYIQVRDVREVDVYRYDGVKVSPWVPQFKAVLYYLSGRTEAIWLPLSHLNREIEVTEDTRGTTRVFLWCGGEGWRQVMV